MQKNLFNKTDATSPELPNSSQFELVAGMEIHVQLNTEEKLFSSDFAAAGGDANSHLSIISLGLPGALPVLNKQVIEKAVRIGLALNCKIQNFNTFDRKSYFYADLPKGYQITQDENPICIDGFLDVKRADGIVKRIRINRIHLEEDAGKSLHDQDPDYSYIDLNRAGVPLIEIVTEPDIRTAEEAGLILSEIRKLIRHLDVSDGNMEAGNLRCDANISIRPIGQTEYGTRCEVKNLNSIRNLKKAIEFEFKRQLELNNKNIPVVQSTLNFDPETGETSPMRTKEEANDYRYFPDPDLPPIFISDEWLNTIKENMPELPSALINRLHEDYGISLEDASILVNATETFKFFNLTLPNVSHPKTLVNFLNGPIRALLSERQIEIDEWLITPNQLAKIINLVDDRKITHQSVFQELIPALEGKTKDAEQLAMELNLLVSNDTQVLETLVEQVLAKYEHQVAAYKKGKKGVLGLFVGEVMKEGKGKFDPVIVNSLIIKKLENEKN